MQLYTVEIDNLQTITQFDMRGKKTGEKSITLTQTIRDLPQSTAAMYARTSAPGKCRVIKQDMSTFGEKRRHQVRFSDTKSTRIKRPEPTSLKAKPVAAPVNKLIEAASTGDMSAAINAGE